jgi:hypothetical protein
VLSGDQLYEHFLPIALRALATGPAVLRPAAADAAAACLRAVRRPQQRSDVLIRLLRDLGRSRSCGRRLAFLDVCVAVLRRFSSRCSLCCPLLLSIGQDWEQAMHACT